MSHLILKNDKQQADKMAWHRLTEIRTDLTLENNWLNEWEIEPKPLFFDNGKESGFSILGVSDKTDLTIGSPYNPDTFRPINNNEFIGLVRDCIGTLDCKLSSVGSVRNRGRVFISLELKGMEHFEAAGRKFGAFLNFGDGRDKSSVLWVNTSNICSVCDNTFGFNLFAKTDGDDISVKERHTKNVTLKFPDIAKLIDKAIGFQTKFKTELENMAKKPSKIDWSRAFILGSLSDKMTIENASKRKEKGKEAVPTRTLNTVDRITELFVSGRGNNGQNRADLFSAFTDYYTHESSSRENRQKQFTSSEYGSASVSKRNVFATLSDDDKAEKIMQHGKALFAL